MSAEGVRLRQPHLGPLTGVQEGHPGPFASAGTELHTGTLHHFGEQVEEITVSVFLADQN